MSLYALVSPGGSPGVTTAALALSLGWPGQVILAECDPSGGDILAGLFAGHMPARNGLLALAIEAGQNPDVAAAALWPELIELDDERGRLLLAGISDPRQSTALAPAGRAPAPPRTRNLRPPREWRPPAPGRRAPGRWPAARTA